MWGRRLSAIVASAAASVALAFLLTSATAGAAGTSGTQVFSTDVLPGLSSLAAAPLMSAAPVQIGITMSNPNAAAQEAAYEAIYNPQSPQYQQFLSPQQVVSQFGLPATTFSQIESWATRDGLRPVFSTNTREYLMLQGTAAQAEQTFSVTMHSYTALGKTFYANVNGPTVPTGLDINGVIGLNGFLGAHTFDHKPPPSAPHGPTPTQSMCVLTGCVGLTTPEDLWSVYDQPKDISTPTADFGQGQQMAVLGEGEVQHPLSDLRLFEKEFALPQIPVTIDSVGDDFQDTSGDEEWDIDSQASTGMSPRAYGETWIFAKDLTDSSVEADLGQFESSAKLSEANASFGECEEDPTSTVVPNPPQTGFGGLAGTAGVMFTQASENTLQQAVIQGKTLFASTGDTGSSCPVVAAAVIGAGNGVVNQGYPETNYPASSPYVVAVGGTVLYTNPNTATPPASNTSRFTEYGWTFGGGGDTFYVKQPDYQYGMFPLNQLDCLSQPNGTPYSSPTLCRAIPDVAAQSGDVASNGYAITFNGQSDSAGGGTSLASPLWMGMWARIQAASARKRNGIYTNGFADPLLYRVGRNTAQDPTGFFDVGNGTTSSPITANGYYTSQPRTPLDPTGWDFLSGLGSPDVCNLTRDVDGVTNCDKAADNVTAPPPNDCGQDGLPSCSAAVCTNTANLWTNPPHTATDTLGNEDPQLSLLKGNMSLSSDDKTLYVRITVSNLTKTVPTGAAADEWYMSWTFGGTSYFGNAELTATAAATGGSPTFSDGTVVITGNEHQYTPVHTDTGSFTTGPNGVIQIDIPLANVGTPGLGALLQKPAGETDIEIGVPGGGGLLEAVDAGGPSCEYQLGTGTVS
jgi:pseudomonalisin